MTDNQPQIVSLKPLVLPDNRRITMEMVVENLPTVFSNISFTMPDPSSPAPTSPPKPDPEAVSPYPNIELTILNNRRQIITSTFIVEHKEQFTALTLHLRAPAVAEQYIARAEMTYQDQIIDQVEVPFRLNQTN